MNPIKDVSTRTTCTNIKVFKSEPKTNPTVSINTILLIKIKKITKTTIQNLIDKLVP